MEVERPRTLRTRIVRLFALERREISRTRHTSRFAYLLRRKFALAWHLRVKVNYRRAGYGEWPCGFSCLLFCSVIKARRCAYVHGSAIEARACDLWIGCVMCISTSGHGNRDRDLFLVAHTPALITNLARC